MNSAWVRLAVLIVLVINQSLVALGWNPLPFEEVEIYNAFSSVAVVVASIYAWWKNNNITEEAMQAQKQLDRLKAKKN